MIRGVRTEAAQPKSVRGNGCLQCEGLLRGVWLSQPDAHPIVRQHSLGRRQGHEDKMAIHSHEAVTEHTMVVVLE